MPDTDVRTDRSLVLGAVTNWAAFAATLAVGFFLAPYLVRSLGDARYGVWCVVESILAYFTLFDLGIAALSGFVAADIGRLARAVSEGGAVAALRPFGRYVTIQRESRH